MPSLDPNREKWKLQATCYRSYDWGFFGSRTQRKASVTDYCTNCPVRVECRMAQSPSNGAWGGRIGTAV